MGQQNLGATGLAGFWTLIARWRHRHVSQWRSAWSSLSSMTSADRWIASLRNKHNDERSFSHIGGLWASENCQTSHTTKRIWHKLLMTVVDSLRCCPRRWNVPKLFKYLGARVVTRTWFAVKGCIDSLDWPSATTSRWITFPTGYCDYAIKDGVQDGRRGFSSMLWFIKTPT